MMKFLVILALLVVAAIAFPQPQQGGSQFGEDVVEYTNNNDGSGNYDWKAVLRDGSAQEAVGSLKKNPDSQAEFQDIQTVVGRYSYVTPEGKTVTVEYTADEGGLKQRTVIS